MSNALSRTAQEQLKHRAGAALANALKSGDIVAAFQPKVSLDTNEMVGMEALARWTSPEFGRVAPDVFIPLAEEQGLIGELTHAVLRDALSACAILRREAPGMTVAVNISPLLLTDKDLPDQIDSALREAGLPPQALVAEVTESHVIAPGARATLTALRRRGIGCSIDDFGTGHASLLSLMQMPFSELKIDRAFVAGCGRDRGAEMIVRATLGLAREMKLHVVAEGIETESTESMLRDLGCNTGQGYRYGRAMNTAGILASMKQPVAEMRYHA